MMDARQKRPAGTGRADTSNLQTDYIASATERKPATKGGDTGNTGDTAPHKAFSVPTDKQESGDAKTQGPHFDLVEHADGKCAPGVYWCDVAKDAGSEPPAPQWICSPLKVAAMTRDDANGEWGRLLIFKDADGQEHRWACPQSLHAGGGDELRSTLLREGLSIASNSRARAKLGDYIQQARPKVRARCVTRTGWHGDTFALPRGTFGDSELEPILFQGTNFDGVPLARSGELQAWTDSVAAPCAGNARLVLAVAMGFAGPCLGLVQAEGGGVHFRGPSSTGKSTALHVASSVYGSPERYAQTWRATDNGLEGTAALHSDLLLVLDELGQLDPHHAGQVAYLLANGQGKQRSHRDGSPRAVPTWRVLFLSAGEIGLGDLVTQDGGRVRAGQEVRVIDVPADAGAGLGLFDVVPEGVPPGVFADSLKAAAAKYHGTALPAFLQALTAGPQGNRDVLQQLRASIVNKLTANDAPGQVRRVADRFALIAAAGELATVLNLTGWNTGEAEQAAVKCFRAWLCARGTEGNAEPAMMLAQVRAFLERHGDARFTPWHASDMAPRTVNRAGFRKDSTDGHDGPTFYVEGEAFRREVCKGFDPRAVADVLADRGALARGGDGRDTQKTRLPDGRNTRVYIITPALWGDA